MIARKDRDGGYGGVLVACTDELNVSRLNIHTNLECNRQQSRSPKIWWNHDLSELYIDKQNALKICKRMRGQAEYLEYLKAHQIFKLARNMGQNHFVLQ